MAVTPIINPNFKLIPPPVKELGWGKLHERPADEKKAGIHRKVKNQTSPTLNQKTDQNRHRQKKHAEKHDDEYVDRDGGVSDQGR
jgi:hypothetical protein